MRGGRQAEPRRALERAEATSYGKGEAGERRRRGDAVPGAAQLGSIAEDWPQDGDRPSHPCPGLAPGPGRPARDDQEQAEADCLLAGRAAGRRGVKGRAGRHAGRAGRVGRRRRAGAGKGAADWPTPASAWTLVVASRGSEPAACGALSPWPDRLARAIASSRPPAIAPDPAPPQPRYVGPPG